MNILMKILWVILMILVYVCANYYVAKRFYQAVLLPLGKINLKIYAGGMITLALSVILRFMLMSVPVNSEAKQIVNWVTSYWMGFFTYLLMAFLVTDILVLAGRAVGLVRMTQGKRKHVSFVAMLLAVFVCCDGVFNVKNIEHVSYDVNTIRGTISEEANIVLISDLHLGAVDSDKRLERAVKKINQLDADIVCIAGDIFDNDYYEISDPESIKGLLRQMKTKYGVYACLGNHDAGTSFREMEAFLDESNIRCLKEEHVVIHNQFILAGRLDSNPIGGTGSYKRGDFSQVLEGADKNLPVVVMDHNPENIKEYQKEVDLILCGHTHHGQIWPGNIITDAMYDVAYGHYQKEEDSPHVIVTSGAGLWGMPMRIGTVCEVVSVKLKSK